MFQKLNMTRLLYILITLIIYFIFSTSCISREEERSTQAKLFQLKESITDSINSMRLTCVDQMIEEGKGIASDSSDYYAFVASDAMLNFYRGEADVLNSNLNKIKNYLSNSQNKGNRDLELRYLMIKSVYYTNFYPNLDSMLFYNEAAYKCAEIHFEASQQIIPYNNMASAYKQIGALDKSIMFYKKAIYLSDSLSLPVNNYIPLYEGLSATYIALRDFEQSEIWLNKSAELWDVMPTYDKYIYLTNRGNFYFYSKEYDKSLNTFLHLDTFLINYPNMIWERNLCFLNLADIYLKIGQLNKTEEIIGKTLDYYSNQGADMFVQYIRTQQMELAYQRNNYTAVSNLIREEGAINHLLPEHKLLRFEFLNGYYSKLGLWEEAHNFQRRYTYLRDSLANERIRMRTSELRTRYERDARILKQENKIVKNERHLLMTYIWLIIVLTLLLGVIFIVFYTRKRNMLRESNMLNRIMKLRMENTRNRITPHFIYNALNNELYSQQMGRESQLNTLVDMLREGQMQANVFCTKLEDELRFIALYVEIESRTVGGFSYKVELEEGIEPDKVLLPSMMVHIFVENAIKHGLKNHSYFEKNNMEKRLQLSIFKKDNGVIIEVMNTGKSYSLAGSSKSTKIGMKVLLQTIQLLNEKNSKSMYYDLLPYAENNETGCVAQLFIPDNYNLNVI